jgi:hypothetical protein
MHIWLLVLEPEGSFTFQLINMWYHIYFYDDIVTDREWPTSMLMRGRRDVDVTANNVEITMLRSTINATLVSTRRRRSENVDESTIGLASSWLTQISWTVSLIINEVFYILLVWILLVWTFTVFKKLNLKSLLALRIQ